MFASPRRTCQRLKYPDMRSLIALLGLAILTMSGTAEAQTDRITLPGNVNPLIRNAHIVGRVAPTTRLRLTLSLPLRNREALMAKIDALYTPDSEEEGRYLTPEAFAEQFGPTLEDYNAVAAFARMFGMEITGTHTNRLLLGVAGSVEGIERAFGIHLMQYQMGDGSVFQGPDREPSMPFALGGKILGVIGLDNAMESQSDFKWRPQKRGFARPNSIGSGPSGGLSPGDIKTAYNLTDTYLDGKGQTLALFELDGFKQSDITQYEDGFGLPHVPLQVVKVDGFSGTPGKGQGEVTLDIELMTALAPGASKILVYEAPNNGASILDLYSRIANDNAASIISTSWSYPENAAADSFFASEAQIFVQFVVQGQSFFSSCGDFGAYDDKTTPIVANPAANPFVIGVGGTRLTPKWPGGPWQSETAWGDPTPVKGAPFGTGGGGGISQRWNIPQWQVGVQGAFSFASDTMRNVPDVSLNAAQGNGYSAYIKGKWGTVYGTSCAAPLWAAFAALVNQQRALNGKSALGFPGMALYKIGTGPHYSQDFHDIADNSNNLLYPAVPGYDDATGWGSFNGINLLLNLAGSQQLLQDPGFENGANFAPWSTTDFVINPSGSQPAHSGGWLAWLGGYGQVHTDRLTQGVTLPASATSAKLTFWMQVKTDEATQLTAFDTLKVNVRGEYDLFPTTLLTFSNLDHSAGYKKYTLDLSAYIGQRITLELQSDEDSSYQTSFFVDDFALIVK